MAAKGREHQKHTSRRGRKRQHSRSSSHQPPRSTGTAVPPSPWLGLSQNIHKRRQEAEAKLVEEEALRRIDIAIEKMVQEALDSEELRKEVDRRLEEGRKRIAEEVTSQRAKEKEQVALEAQQKEEAARCQGKELQRIREENQRKTEEALRRAAEEQARRAEERYRKLEILQQQKEEALRRKQLQEEQERLEQMKTVGKRSARPKVSFALSSK